LLNGSFNYRGGGFVKEIAYLSGGYPISPIRLLAAAGMDEGVEKRHAKTDAEEGELQGWEKRERSGLAGRTAKPSLLAVRAEKNC
jgi:hypothetical protein